MGLRINPGPACGSKSSERLSSIHVKGFLHLFENSNRPHFTEYTRRTAARLPIVANRRRVEVTGPDARRPLKEGYRFFGTLVAYGRFPTIMLQAKTPRVGKPYSLVSTIH